MLRKPIICPQHNKPAKWVDDNHYQCPKCFCANYVPDGCTPTEYDRCREIEKPYRMAEGGFQFNLDTAFFHKVNQFLAHEFKYPLPVLTGPEGEEDYEFTGVYKGRHGKFGVVRGKIVLRPYAGIITLIHEFTHHIALCDRLKVSDHLAYLHGANYLVVEEMLLKSFAAARKENIL